MVRKYAMTEDEFLAMHIDPVDGHLKSTRDNGDTVDFGVALGPAVTDEQMADIAAAPEGAFRTELLGTSVDAAAIAQGVVYPAGAAFGAITYQALQDACDAAATQGKRVWAAGSLTTDQTLTVKSDADLGNLSIDYTGSGAAVVLGDNAEVVYRLTVHLPRLRAANKTVAGWGQVAGTIGVRAVNLNSCAAITVPKIENFETGLLIYGNGQGIAYNTFMVGHLANNKINLKLDASSTGWANQNTFIGGRYGHNSGEGANVSGAFHIKMVAGLPNPINNNIWLNPSIEADTPQFHVDAAGTANMLIGARWEAFPAKIRWQAGATRNQVVYGYGSHAIQETYESIFADNLILSSSSMRFAASNSKALLWLENASSNTNAVMSVMAAGAVVAGTDPETGYCVRLSSQKMGFKRASDVGDRVMLDAQNGRVYFGDGAAAPTAYFGAFGAGVFGVSGAHLAWVTHNAQDIGLAAGNRPRYVRAGTALVTGAFTTANRPSAVTAGEASMIWDKTIKKILISDGSAWVDAMGNAV